MSKYFARLLGCLSIFISFLSCNNDDGISGPKPPIPFDVQALIDDPILVEFLSTHTYNKTEFDNDISGSLTNNDIKITRLPKGVTEGSLLSMVTTLKMKITTDLTQNLYVLKIRGAIEDSELGKLNLSDSQRRVNRFDPVNLSFKTNYIINDADTPDQLILSDIFDEALPSSPVWRLNGALPLQNLNQGLTEATSQFKAAVPIDPSVPCRVFNVLANGEIETPNGFGIGIVFMPSSLGYYNLITRNPKTGVTIPQYSNLVITFSTYNVEYTDHDNDGILSVFEDLNSDTDFSNDDTDRDGIPNYLDTNDDNDNFLTAQEVVLKDNDATIDSNCDNVFNNDNDRIDENLSDRDSDGNLDHLQVGNNILE